MKIANTLAQLETAQLVRQLFEEEVILPKPAHVSRIFSHEGCSEIAHAKSVHRERYTTDCRRPMTGKAFPSSVFRLRSLE
jgi:hypothetical protein